MIKTLTFGVMHVTIAFTVVYLMTGSVALGGLLALIEPACNTIGYFVHERLWERAERRRLPGRHGRRWPFGAFPA